MRHRPLILLLWILGILFPLAALGRFSPAFRGVFDALFAPLWMHIVMHALLFGGLVVLLFFALRWKMGKRTALGALLAVLVVGLLQETLQSLSQGAWPLLGMLADLGVDLAGGTLALVLVWLWTSRPARPISEY